MYGDYLYALESKYGYTGNWRPDTEMKIGCYFPYEKSFAEWIKRSIGMKSRAEAMNVNLRDYSNNDIIKGLKPRKFVLNTEYITSGVSISAEGSLGEIGLSANKRQGFFISLNNVFERRIDNDAIRKIRENKNNFTQGEYIAVVTGITYACGVVVIFNEQGASLKLSNKSLLGSAGSVKSKAAPVLEGKINISAQSGDCIIFKSDNLKKPLMPFLKISILKYREAVRVGVPVMDVVLPARGVLDVRGERVGERVVGDRRDFGILGVDEIKFSYSDLIDRGGDLGKLIEGSVPNFKNIGFEKIIMMNDGSLTDLN